tara:strand:+ start:2257 stop:2559 length:303 start_codon:yes stop_codon:yes gene_type:complete
MVMVAVQHDLNMIGTLIIIMETNDEERLVTISMQIKDAQITVHQKHKEISILKQTMDKLEKQQHELCLRLHKESWKCCRETGPYGGKFQYCTKCNCDVYS